MSGPAPTPWYLDSAGLIRDADKQQVIAEYDTRRRIVASVNACAGIPVEALEELTDASKETARKFFIRLAGGDPQ